MAKRFTDTEKWKRPWFRTLPVAYKCLWIYICDECDIAGTWYVDMELASYQIGEKLDKATAFGHFEKQVAPLNDGARWQIKDFAPFQYGALTPNNNLHKAVLGRLDAIENRGSPMNSSSISAPEQPLNSPSSGAKDKDKVMVGVKVFGGSGGFDFATVWNRYPRKLGRKLAERHFNASVKTAQDFSDIQNALECFIREMRKEGRPDDKIPYGVTWMNNWRDWVNYGGVVMPKPPPPPPPPPRKPEPPLVPMTEADLLEMHRVTVAMMKRCATPDCQQCAKIKKLEGMGS